MKKDSADILENVLVMRNFGLKYPIYGWIANIRDDQSKPEVV